MSNEEEAPTFYVTSNFGHRTQKPFVMISMQAKEFTTQMTPDEARDLAMNLIACAEASEQDAFFITFLRKRVGAEDNTIAVLLNEFREWREGGDDER